MRNIEIKAPLHDRAAMERRLAALGAERVWTRRQWDTFFAVPAGWLKLREAEGASAELIAYRRATDTAGPRASAYDALPVEDAGRWRRLLGRVLPEDGVVEKERTLWRLGRTRVHLDRVAGLGEFLELETLVEGRPLAVARAEAEALIAALGLDPATFIAVPYRDLLRS